MWHENNILQLRFEMLLGKRSINGYEKEVDSPSDRTEWNGDNTIFKLEKKKKQL